MTTIGSIQIVIYLMILYLLAKPLGIYIAWVFQGKVSQYHALLGLPERIIYRLCGINAEQPMSWKGYLASMLCFNAMCIVALYALQRAQGVFPLNPQLYSGITPDLAFSTAISFVTNSDWQAYVPEASMSYLTQMAGLTVQNFISAATGIALLMAFIRGIVQREGSELGNFWVDLVRGIIYLLLPLSFMLSILLVSQGVIQNFKPYQTVELQHPFILSTSDSSSSLQIAQQIIPMGPVASQVAIKQLGSNGGGFFNANAAHPFENPTPLSNFLEMLALLLIPVSLCHTFGRMAQDDRQGLALIIAMSIILVPLMGFTVFVEQQGNPIIRTMQVDESPRYGLYPAGNMEGKETRFGITSSAIWAVATTASSNGSVNGMMDSFMPLGGLIPLWLMQLGEVVFGGTGSGLMGMLVLVMMTVFIAGLMVGRTPEYLGKKIEPYEMKMASVAVLLMPIAVLLFTALAVMTDAGKASIGNPGPHGLTEVLYSFTSMVNNNGSAMSGLNANTLLYNLLGGLGMLVGRFWIAIPMLAIAGSMVRKKRVPTGLGTLATHTPLFIVLLIGITLLIGALSFLPTLALGPIVEHLNLGVATHTFPMSRGLSAGSSDAQEFLDPAPGRREYRLG